MTVLMGVALLGLAFAGVSALVSWRARTRLLARIRREWGSPRVLKRDMHAVADFFRSHAVGPSLDDRTWDDLLLDDIFAFVDRAESSIGQQILYHRLRLASVPRNFPAFEALVSRASRDAAARERAQMALARFRDPAAYYLHRLADPDVLVRRRWHVLFPLSTLAMIGTLTLGFVAPALLFAALIGFIVNFVIRVATARRIGVEVVWFRQLGPLMSCGHTLLALDDEGTAAITGCLRPDLTALGRLGAAARWLSRDPLVVGDLAGVMLEFFNVLLLLDANAMYFASRELRLLAPQLLRVLEAVGEVDAAIAVASLREGADGWTRPQFAGRRDASAVLAGLRHPLVDNAVPNSIALAPPHGLLVTGSNMSGKSTFLRTVGVNVVLAQTINTCFARGYEAPVYQVRSCIGRADDLIAGKSYYLVEVESVLDLVTASELREPHLFLFDELFRGTNAVERIAAAEAVLDTLVSRGKPHVVLAAIHDGELVDLLHETYSVCHFGDVVGPEGLEFNYQLAPGPATSRNAIALLELNGAPESLVNRALARAAALDVQRERWKAR
jgi:MutS-like protein